MKWWSHAVYGVAFLWVVAMAMVFVWYAVVVVELDKQYYRQQPNPEDAERMEYLKTLRVQGLVQRVLAVLTPAVMLILVCLVVGVGCLHVCKQASVPRYKLGPHDIIIHERDLSLAASAAFKLLHQEKTPGEALTPEPEGNSMCIQFMSVPDTDSFLNVHFLYLSTTRADKKQHRHKHEHHVVLYTFCHNDLLLSKPPDFMTILLPKSS